jgi:hypothetical protein
MESDSLSTETLLLNATQTTKNKSSCSSSSLSTEALILIATQPTNADSMSISKLTLRDPGSSTPSDVSLSDDDQEFQKAAKHLQHITHLLTSQTPPSFNSEGDLDEDYQMEMVNPIPLSQQSLDLPSNGDRPDLPSKLGK